MSFNITPRFNGGNGGVSVSIERETGRTGLVGSEETESLGEFLNPKPAIELGLKIIEKAFNSLNAELPTEVRRNVMDYYVLALKGQLK